MKIDPEKSIPKYLQLKDIMIRHFTEAHYQAGQQIPTENDFMAQFAVSRSTVRQTLAELVSAGIIYKKQGSGTFFAGTTTATQARSYLIGVITPRISYYIYPQLLQGVDEIARARNYNIVMGNANADPEKELACLKQLLDKGVDGILLEPTGGFQEVREARIFQELQRLTIPVVLMDWAIDEFDRSYVSIDDVQGGFLATQYLIEAGHRRIAYVYPQDKIPAQQRLEGYRNALEAAQIDFDPRFAKSTSTAKWDEPHHLYAIMQELLDSGDARPTAVFFFNDDGALHAYDAILDAGLRIPADISLIGFDNSEMGVHANIPLTSITHSKYHIGRWAAEILFDEIEHPGALPIRQLLIKPTIVERESVKNMR